jgi:uncharacterized protein YecT (DUF1311 family)
VRVVGLFLTLFGFGQAEVASAQIVGRTEKRCSDASSQAETLSCYFDLAATSRAEVQRAFERNLQSAMAQDREFNAYSSAHGMLDASLVKRLRTSQAAWLQYSDAQCGFEGGSSSGGSGEDILDAACHHRMNASRLQELEAARELFER